MDFVALDVETANTNCASICQVGLVQFENGTLKRSWTSLVNPHEPFDPMNVFVHGIDATTVRDAPSLPAVFYTLSSWLMGSIVACHTAFDRVAIDRALTKYNLGPLPVTWLDTARVARRTWAECAWSGYGLPRLAEKLGIEYRSHDAGEDARACGEVLLRAIDETGIGIEKWLERVEWPLIRCHSDLTGPPTRLHESIHLEGDPDGDLFGHVLVFTGALDIPREEAARLAARAGCRVDVSVTKHTTLLVVGCQDLNKLAGREKSSKHRRAEALIAKGQSIRILSESDFQQIVRCRGDK